MVPLIWKMEKQIPERNIHGDDIPWSPFAGFAAAISLVIASIFCSALIGQDGEHNIALQVLVSDGIVACGILLLISLKTEGRGTLSAIRLAPPSPIRLAARSIVPVAAGTVAVICSMLLQNLVSSALDIQMPAQPVVEWLAHRRETGQYLSFFLLAGLAISLVPFTEELIFRGMLYLPLRSRYGVLPAAVLTSMVFAALHSYPAGTGMTAWVTMGLVWLHLFVLGTVFCALIERTESLWAPIFIHGLYNAIMIAVIFLTPQYQG
jgi:membrane protease YdiL (CAAX protease family)